MNRRILSVIIAVLGLVAIALAVCSATVWRPSSTAQASLAQNPDQHYVVTEPGVLSLVESDVKVTATAASADQQVFIAVGHAQDVDAWLAADPFISVTGLLDWNTLASEAVTTRCPEDAAVPTSAASASSEDATAAATAAESAVTEGSEGCTDLENSDADPADSDLWITSKTGTGSATLELDTSGSDLVVLVATDGASNAPQLSLSWPRHVSTPWLIPGLVLGGMLLLVGVFLFLIDIQMRHADEQRRARAAQRAARMAQADSVATVGIPQIGDPDRPLTRREQRDKERAEQAGEEWVDPRTGAVYLGGVEAPSVPQAPAPEPEDLAAGIDAVGASGAARGSAVVPGLDAEATAAYRAGRELADDVPLALATAEGTTDADAPAQSAGDVAADGPDAAQTAELDVLEPDALAEYENTAEAEQADADSQSAQAPSGAEAGGEDPAEDDRADDGEDGTADPRNEQSDEEHHA
ncbi:hypothetical protein [Actinomyces sp. 565]|uniref:hypothetical protein n=1 Tax=Actinomyces sp. 565 TaxID=2057794 RepID=UPI0013A6F3D5|nr:hypothetical protein [Actinomyces sp. 565]